MGRSHTSFARRSQEKLTRFQSRDFHKSIESFEGLTNAIDTGVTKIGY